LTSALDFLKIILNMIAGDPEDRSLRNVEVDVLIPKKMRDKARDEKCTEEVKGKFC
jgi:COX assembly protein 1